MKELKQANRARLAFYVILLLILALFIVMLLSPNNGHAKLKAEIMRTHYEENDIATVLRQQAIETKTLSNINNSFIFQALLNQSGDYENRTNTQGEILDVFETPYQIEIKPPTNFVIHSAGPNKKFDDADDIIFNSVSNDFVKP